MTGLYHAVRRSVCSIVHNPAIYRFTGLKPSVPAEACVQIRLVKSELYSRRALGLQYPRGRTFALNMAVNLDSKVIEQYTQRAESAVST